MYNTQSSNSNRDYKIQLIAGYSEIIESHVANGWEGYFINFMFNQIPGSASHRMQIMEYEVGRVYGILTQHVLRWPDRQGWRDLRPKFIGSPDLPVWKHEKELVSNLIVNDGLHYNVVALMPPTRKVYINGVYERVLFGRQSRLLLPLDEHLWKKQKLYSNDVLARIHTTPISKGTMADYTLKAFKHGRVDGDAIHIWG